MREATRRILHSVVRQPRRGGRGGCGSTKWVATAVSIWIQCTSGSSYCFGIYSPILKLSQGYDQSTLDSVAAFKDVGANVGLLSGLLYAASARPWLVHAAGALQCFVGYFFIWLSVTGAVPRPPVPLMCLYMLLAAHAQTFFNTANVVTAVENFPDHRGTVVGIMKGFLGLSGAILIQMYQTIYKDDPSSFLLMLALLPTLTPLLLMCFVRVYLAKGRHDKENLNTLSLMSLITAFYLMAVIIWKNMQFLGTSIRIIIFVLLLFLLISPLCVAIRAQLRGNLMDPETSIVQEKQLLDEADQPEIVDEKLYMKHDRVAYHKIPIDAGQESSSHGKKIRGQNLNLIEAMCTVDFWLLFLTMACGMGSGLATVNNISQIGGSLGYKSIETSTLVSLWSIWNFLGRFGAGYVSDYFLHLKGYGRPLFIAIALAAMSGGHVIIASGLPGALYAGSIVVGVCYGSQWSLMPTIASEIFGLRHLGTIFNTIAVASPCGSYILSVWIVGYIYDRGTLTSKKTCTGTHCFMLSFLIMACATLSGCFVAMVLFLRTKQFYKQVIYAKLLRSSIEQEG